MSALLQWYCFSKFHANLTPCLAMVDYLSTIYAAVTWQARADQVGTAYRREDEYATRIHHGINSADGRRQGDLVGALRSKHDDRYSFSRESEA